MTKWTKENLVIQLDNFEKKWSPTEKAVNIKLKIDFFADSDLLISYNGSTHEVTINEKNKDILASLDRVGALELISQFSSTAKIKTAGKIPNSMKTNDVAWKDWLGSILFNGKFEVKLIPDTNFLRRHYCSNILLPLLGDGLFRKLKFSLPRLAILEIEAKYNLQKRNDKEKLRYKEKRLAFYTAREILFLREYGASLLPQLDPATLEGFSHIAGESFTDAWIRREVHNFKEQKVIPSSGHMTEKGDSVIFLTCDLMNALSAIAEDIPTLFFSRVNQEKFFMENHSQLAELIIDLAVTFGKIKMSVDLPDGKKEFYLEGMWHGKTIPDWEKDTIYATSIVNKSV